MLLKLQELEMVIVFVEATRRKEAYALFFIFRKHVLIFCMSFQKVHILVIFPISSEERSKESWAGVGGYFSLYTE